MVRLEYKEYLKPEMLNELGNSAQIENAGVIRRKEETGFDKNSFEIEVKFSNGRVLTWNMNGTSQKRLGGAWGKDTEGWKGKTVHFLKTESIFNGKKTVVLYGEPTPNKSTAS